MTAIQAIESLLTTEWEPSVTGRTNDVPEPEYTLQKEDIKKRLRTSDVARIVDGGNVEYEQKGFGATHQGERSVVTIELRTADRGAQGSKVNGRVRLYGEREGLNPPERHGGLVGETVRILKKHRGGFAEYDRLEYGPVRDQSDMVGGGYYRADVDVVLLTHASNIDPSV